ncbi:MAG: PKD domain-containing protein, partial [Geobacteraceae bacterium]|nr:PKD domain-containing protein [Geobacteraceae bacterium]
GGGGASLYTPDPSYPNIVKVDKSYHHTEIDINGSTLTSTARRADGTVIEAVTVSHGTGNQPPVANAGVDQSVTDADGSGSESVTLNGSASSDPDGTISSYVWNEGATQIATGATPTVTLAVGSHTITLTVTDNGGATATDTVVVTVQAQVTTPPGSFSLVAPTNGKTNVAKTPAFDWSDSANAASYGIVVDNNSDFSSPEINVGGLTSSAYTSTVTLGSKTVYYWKVTATNAYGSTTSPVFSFTTKR